MADLFRKSLLEKLSSPEQLDKMIVITLPRFWIAMAGAGLMIGAALIWSVFGRLPENVDVQGVYVNEGGSYNVYSTAAGVIDAVCVEEGATVKKGDVIALLDSVELRERQAQYQDRIEKVQAVTIDSVEDVVTADNKNLIDIKNELLTANQTLLQDQASLELKLSELGEQRQKLLEAEEIMCTEEAWYYESINTDDSNSEQIDFSSAQNSLSTASSYLESAYASLDQAQVAYAHAEGNYQNMESKLNQIAAQKESLQKGVSETKKKFRKQYDQYVAAGGEAGLSITLENVKAFLESVNSEQYPELVQTAQKYIAAAEKEAANGSFEAGKAAETSSEGPASEGQTPVDIEAKPEITYEDFARLQFQVGEIIACEAVPKSKKLLCSQVKIGSQVRQIVSGIKAHYTPEEMVGKKVMVLVNLKPATLAGVVSEGMLLCAEDADGNLALMTAEKPMPSGAEIC